MIEEWRDINDFEGIYQISNFGRIKALERQVKICGGAYRTIKEHFIKPVKCRNGYLEASLSVEQKRTVRLLHRVVAQAFIPNPDNLPEVNHKDENIQNCRVDNLEWCTSKYNANYGTRNIRMIKENKVKPVLQFSKDGDFVKQWNSLTEAGKEYGVDVSAIIRVCKGKQKTSKGYVWKYA